MKSFKFALAGALAAGLAFGAGAASADIKPKKFTVVGTWGFLDHWKEREGPFWNETLPKVTNGAYTANAKSQTEVGLSGFEIMKLLKLGTYDAVHGVTTYVAQDSPAIEGADLVLIHDARVHGCQNRLTLPHDLDPRQRLVHLAHLQGAVANF